VERIQWHLHHFFKVSGLQPNVAKSSIYFAGTSEYIQRDITLLLGFEVGYLPFRYLGLPMTSKRLSQPDWAPLTQKITAKLRHWSSRLLSYAGRLELIKSVLRSIEAFWGSIILLPSACISEVEAIVRNFLWSGDASKTKQAKVAWHTVCTPTEAGGLGLTNFHLLNKALILKHLWSIVVGKETLWIRWIHSKYLYLKEGRLGLRV